MPRIRPGMPRPPAGFDLIAARLDEYDEEMRRAVQDESTGVVGQTRRPPREATRKRARGPSPPATHKDGNDEKQTGEQEGTVADEHARNTTSAEDSTATTAAAAVPPLWRVAQINNARTRYVYDALHRTRTISKAVYDYCVDMQFIDGSLARRWRLPGYEQLCCTACAMPGVAGVAAAQTMRYALRNTAERKQPHKNNSSDSGSSKGASSSTATCICRVPAAERRDRAFVACAVCGCHGCCSADARARSA